MSNSASLPASPYDPYERSDSSVLDANAPAWKQEVNQRLAAHRNRRSGPLETALQNSEETTRQANSRAAEAAARVAKRYANAPSYSELLAGEARAVVRAAGAAAEAARNAQAAAQAVLAGLESGPVASGLWEPAGHPAQQVQHTNPAVNRAPAPAPQLSAAEAAWAAMPATPARWQDEPPAAHATLPLPQPRWEEALPVQTPVPPASSHDLWDQMRLAPAPPPLRDETYTLSYNHLPEEGELFAFDPVNSATVEPVQSIPANLIEFPKELIAPKKARPRLVEAQFYNPAHESPQLSIFEVDPSLLAPPFYMNSNLTAVAPPEWASIELEESAESVEDEHTVAAVYTDPVYAESAFAEPAYAPAQREVEDLDLNYGEVEYGEHSYADAIDEEVLPFAATPARFHDAAYAPPQAVAVVEAPAESHPQTGHFPDLAVETAVGDLHVASIGDRILASIVDGALVSLAFLASAVVVIASTAHPPSGKFALMVAAAGLILFGLIYECLFLSFSEEGTLGMRYARIALCTFDDDNPTRSQMLWRIPSILLAAIPLGLGLAWAIFDKDHLGWQDRLTRTYQRKY